MDRQEQLQHMQDRINQADARVERLSALLRWTRYSAVIGLALRTAQESAVAWRALRGTLVQTFKLVKARRHR